MNCLNHPNVIKLFEALEDENSKKIYLVMEYCSKGALMSTDYWKAVKEQSNRLLEDELIESPRIKKSIKLSHAKNYLYQIVEGLHYCMFEFIY